MRDFQRTSRWPASPLACNGWRVARVGRVGRARRAAFAVLAAFACLAALTTLPGPAAAQLIPIRSAPIVQADEPRILPSGHSGMGGVSIAMADSAGDAAENPAAGARFIGARVFSAPHLYSVSHEAGEGWALPLGMFARSGAWFGAGALALQSVEPVSPPAQFPAGGGLRLLDGTQDDAGPARGSRYGFALLGRSWPERGLSLGGSVLAARRNAVDGIGLLYGESQWAESAGRVSVFRLGLLKEGSEGRALEAVAVRSRTRMRHDVIYVDRSWDPQEQMQVMEPREERNADDADVLGLHLVHRRPLASGWSIGWLLTANRVGYPSVPRYDLPRDGVMNVPSGRGSAHAWNVGFGLATTDRPLRLGVDLVYEPIWSRIRGQAEAAVATAAGDTIPAGGTTLDNRLRFTNGVVRMGVGREWPVDPAGSSIEVQLGVATRLVAYRLAQVDHRLGAGRDDREQWIEWTPTWSTTFRLGDLELRYNGSVAQGTKRVGAPQPVFGCCFVADLSVWAPGPSPPMELGSVSVVTQQLFVSLPLGGARRGGAER